METKRKQQLQALNISDEKYRTFYNQTPIMLHSIGPDGKLLSVNDYWLKSLGYRREEVIGHQSTEFLTSASKAYAADVQADFYKTGYCNDVEYQFVKKDGTVIDTLLSAASIMDDDGAILQSLAVITEVTQRKRTEAQLQQAQKMEAVGQLTSGLAHDFNNLLAVVMGNLQLVGRSVKDDPVATRRIAAALDATERGAELTKRLLAFSSKQVLEPKVIFVNKLVAGMKELLVRSLGETIELQVSLAEDIAPTEVDPHQLDSVILNLALNARDAMPEGGQLTIETMNVLLDEAFASSHAQVEPGPYVCIAVTDTGIGIPEHLMDQVFQPFFSTKPRDRGTGLGLSMVYGFAKQSGGHVNAYSEEGKGTSIKVYLPCHSSSDVEDWVASSSLEIQPKGGNETILVVEDKAQVRKMATEMLEDLGYLVLQAEHGEMALDILQARSDIDLVFTDIVMPGGISGPDLAKEVYRQYPEVKVLYTSGYAEAAVLREGHVMREKNLVSKPYRQQKLATKVRAILDDT